METSLSVLREMDAPASAPYIVYERAAIASVLDDIRQRRLRPTISCGPSADASFATLVLAVDPSRGSFIFDVHRDDQINEAIIRAGLTAWLCWVEGIKIEFTCGPARLIKHEGSEAFAAPLPERLLRMQRRNAFRAVAPATKPLMCWLDPTQSGKHGLPVRVIDISALGMCLLVSIDELPWTPGSRAERARVDLPQMGTIVTDFEVRYVIPAGARHPTHFRRCGVQFLGLTARESLVVQRYVNDLQRERAKSKID